jgi:hypothetical protein
LQAGKNSLIYTEARVFRLTLGQQRNTLQKLCGKPFISKEQTLQSNGKQLPEKRFIQKLLPRLYSL